MLYRRKTRGLFILILGSLAALSACSSGQDADQLNNELQSQSFQLEFADVDDTALLDCITGLVPDASLSPVSEVGEATPALSALEVFTGNLTIHFEGNEFTIEEDGEIISAGTWTALDANTIDLTENGVSSPFGVTIDGDTLILEVTEETIDVLCAPEADTSDPVPDDDMDAPNDDETPEPNQGALTSDLAGTWCLESGYEFYLSIAIPAAESVNTGFDSYDASVVIDSGDAPAVREVGINEFLQSAWIATGRLSGTFHRYAPLMLDAIDPTVLTVEFAEGKEAVFRKSISETFGECEEAEAPLAPPDETPTAEEETPAAEEEAPAAEEETPPDGGAPAEEAPAEEMPEQV